MLFCPQGVNVIINASTMEDIEPSAIGQRLTNGMASVASPVLSRLRTKEEENGEDGVVRDGGGVRWRGRGRDGG